MEEITQAAGSLKRSLLFGVGGLAYGLVLATIGMGAANGGEGPMIPLLIYGSPLFLPLLFFAPIVIWPTITLILSRARQPTFKKAFVALMMIHYIGAVPYLAIWGDWDHFSQLWSRSSASVFHSDRVLPGWTGRDLGLIRSNPTTRWTGAAVECLTS